MSIIFCGKEITLDRDAKLIFIKIISTVTQGINLIMDVFRHGVLAKSGSNSWVSVWPHLGSRLVGAGTPSKGWLSLTNALHENQQDLAALQHREKDLGLHKPRVGQACVRQKPPLALLTLSRGFS